jgi:RNA polymerase sigma-70 factor, ECF subfamily
VRKPLEPEAFAVEAGGLHRRLTGVAYALCGDRGLAEECAQEALARAWQRVDRGEALDSLEAWTTRVALNWCHSQLRRRGAESRALLRVGTRRETMSRAGGSAEGGDGGERLSAEVHRAVLDLPFRQREVVVLHYLLDYDIATIARVAGISRGAVKNALFHARAALTLRLDEPDEPDPNGEVRGSRAPTTTTTEEEVSDDRP